MEKQNFCLPKGVHLTIDDMGWLYGRDQRDQGLPSRTGVPRRHTIDDYRVIEAIGKEIGMKINALFVIGEWDRKRTLAKVPGSSKWGENWEKSEFYNEEEITEIRDFLNSCEYIELGFHGLLHDSWDENGNFLCDGEHFLPEGNVRGGRLHLAPEDYIRRHMDAFYEIYNDWGLKCPIRTYASPCGCNDAFYTGELTPILKDYGIQFWHNVGNRKWWLDLTPGVQNGILASAKMHRLVEWEAYDLDPDVHPDIPDKNLGIIGGHWVNFLRYNPKKNMENVAGWGRWFRRQAQNFGGVLTEDIAQCHYQGLYEKVAQITYEDDTITIDVSKFDELLPDVCADLFINVKNGAVPTCVGGQISIYRQQDEFANFRIRRQKGVSKIIIK